MQINSSAKSLSLIFAHLERAKKLALRAWRIYVNPPSESQLFLSPRDIPVVVNRVRSVTTASQPKQVTVDTRKNLAYVSCLAGKKVQVFDLTLGLKLIDEIEFTDQCVEVTLFGGLGFATTTNFARDIDELRGVGKRNSLHVIRLEDGQILSSSETGGNWSKVVRISPEEKLAFISNWHTHDLSIFDISDLTNPRLVQVIPCGESPRGIAVLDSGRKLIVTGFYSGNVIELRQGKKGLFQITHVGEPFDFPHYSGNPRDVLLDPHNDNLAWISNLGRNVVHQYLIAERKFASSILVGKSPNSLAFLPESSFLLVSCRRVNAVMVIDTEHLKVVGRSEFTGEAPTGLAAVPQGFLVTGFVSNTLELYRF